MKKSTKRKLRRIKSKIKNAILITIYILTFLVFIISACAVDQYGTNVLCGVSIISLILLMLFAYANADAMIEEDYISEEENW